MTVQDFYDMIMFNSFHNIHIKDSKTDEVVDTIRNVNELVKSKHSNKLIKGFATDWETRFYILWV